MGHFLNACFFSSVLHVCFICVGGAASCHDDYEEGIMGWIMHNRTTFEDDKWPEELADVFKGSEHNYLIFRPCTVDHMPFLSFDKKDLLFSL